MGTVIQDVTLDTTGAWVTIASTRFYSEFAKLLIHIFETVGTNSFIYRVQGANNVDFAGVETLADSVGTAQWTVAASGSDFQSICDCWGWVRVQVINGSGVGTPRCVITGSN